VTDALEKRLHALADGGAVFTGGRIGIEKESLRVTPEGLVAPTPHPGGLGSALTHRYITTDYSEALLELVTPPLETPWAAIQFLCDLHEFSYGELGDELLWAQSMPCRIRSDKDIPLARYGSSNIGRMKTIYRRGLGYRYGRYMQAIAGIHFNYSLPDDFWPLYRELARSTRPADDFRSAAYLGLLRNVRRLDWLLLYFFGASPAVCSSFMQGVRADLDTLDPDTMYGPFATSLRMSDIGYKNKQQATLNISANRLDEYTADLIRATRTPSPEFSRIGVRVNGHYRQLTANRLQIENEYYSTIRPKRVAHSGERPTSALERGGIEYVELRALDVSPFDPVGISEQHVRLMEVFLIYCLLEDSPLADDAEQAGNDDNLVRVAREGRRPDLELSRAGSRVMLRNWGREICERMGWVAEVMDSGGGRGYRDAVQQHSAFLADPGMTPSARFLQAMSDDGMSLFEFGIKQSVQFRDYFRALAPELNTHREMLRDECTESFSRQAGIEAGDDLDFDEFLARYLA